MKRAKSFGLRVSDVVQVVGLAGVLGAVSLVGAPAQAQEEPDAASVGAARNLAIEGVKLADSGDCAGAVVKLGQAEGLYHSHVVVSRLGECEIRLGLVVEGTERLRRLLREPVPEHATPAVLNAFATAKQVLEQSAGKVANLQLRITGPEPSKAVVKINGSVAAAAGLGVDFPVNPGPADIEVSAEGYYPQNEHVTLTAGEKLELSVVLRAEPAKPAAQEVEAPAPQPALVTPASPVGPARRDVTTDEHNQPSYAPVYVSFVLGAAGLGVGAWYGMAAKKDYDTLLPKCQNGFCPSAEGDNLNAAKDKGTIATVGLGVGAASIIVGTIILLTSGSDDTVDAAAPARLWIGDSEVGVAGRF